MSRFLEPPPARWSMIERTLLVALLAIAFVLPAYFLTRKSITYDEVAHLPAGFSYLQTRKIVLNPMHPPLVKELSALPLLFLGADMPVGEQVIDRAILTSYQWRFGRMFFRKNDVQEILAWCRLPIVFLSLGLATVVALWSHALWGPRGALISVFLYALDPTITAHAQLITTDVPLAFFGTLFFFLLRRALVDAAFGRLLSTGIVLGLALATKFTAVIFPPLALGLMVLHRAFPRPDGAPPDEGRARAILVTLISFGCIVAVAALVVWATYFFPRDPLFYWRGLEALQSDHRPNFDYIFLGDVQQGRDLWYFPIAWLLKTPVPTIVILMIALGSFVRGRRASVVEEALLLVPPFALGVSMSLLTDNLGVRYLIPCYPFLYVFAGRLGAPSSTRRRLGQFGIGALLTWLVISFVRISPDHLSYFNEIAGGARRGPEWLGDSNVDWGQGLIQLHEYLEARGIEDYSFAYFGSLSPRFYGVNGKLVPWREGIKPPRSTLILSAHYVGRVRGLLRLEYGDGPENWIAHSEPAAIVGHAYYVYEPVPAAP